MRETNKMRSLPSMDLQLVSMHIFFFSLLLLTKCVSKTGNEWKSIFYSILIKNKTSNVNNSGHLNSISFCTSDRSDPFCRFQKYSVDFKDINTL